MSFGRPRAVLPRSSQKANKKITSQKNVGKSTEENKILSSTLISNSSSSDTTLISCDISEIQIGCKLKSKKELEHSVPKVVQNVSGFSPEDEQEIRYTQLIQLMYSLEVQLESETAMKKNCMAQNADLHFKLNEVKCQEINATEWVLNVDTVCQEVKLLGEKEKQFIELFDEARKLEDLLSELSSGVRNKFTQLHLNNVAMNINSYDAFLHGIVEMSNILQNIIEIANEKSSFFEHLDNLKDVQQLLSKILQCINDCHELMQPGYNKILEVFFMKTLINK